MGFRQKGDIREAKMKVYQIVTDRIIKELEQGKIPWAIPYVGGSGAISRATGKPYSLLNQILLGDPGEYVTFKQCKDEGGKVKKGVKGRIVTYWNFKEVQEKDKDGNVILDVNSKPKIKKIPYFRYYTVFHIDDCEGIAPKWQKAKGGSAQMVHSAQDVFDRYVDREGITVSVKRGHQAVYSPTLDTIKMPEMDQFASSDEYYSTLFHEAAHSTGHKSRLDRLGIGMGKENYAREELIAEMAACMLMSQLGLETNGSFRNNAAYIQNCLKALKYDVRLVVVAAGAAEKAVRMINGEDVMQMAG